ncbi:unnamed protein product [Paramecium sonneborni]|uniref:Uncharacterized protein n=1 Tax=Paramecium sonneborni TaxID=65129 RepID=A0A8S1RJW8_9CILI|nr:unnamed protein product [Paramecium sonneborni]
MVHSIYHLQSLKILQLLINKKQFQLSKNFIITNISYSKKFINVLFLMKNIYTLLAKEVAYLIEQLWHQRTNDQKSKQQKLLIVTIVLVVYLQNKQINLIIFYIQTLIKLNYKIYILIDLFTKKPIKTQLNNFLQILNI